MRYYINIIFTNLYLYLNRIANYQWYNYPFGRKPRASKDEYLKIFEEARSKQYPEIDNFEKSAGFNINKERIDNLALHTQVVIKKSAINYQHGRLLYAALSKYIAVSENRNITILETGTARGFSSLCMAMAMADANIEGKIITYDVLPHNVKMYWNCIDDNDRAKSRAELLSDYNDLIERYIVYHQGDTQAELYKIQFTRVHFAFLDGAHTYKNVMSEYETIRDKQQKGDIVFFDDYTQTMFPGIVKAVDEICNKYGYKKQVIRSEDNRAYVVAEKL